MANKEIERIPLNREWFIKTLKAKNVSIRSLGNPESDHFINWHERTIRRALAGDEPSISPKLLDAIAKEIDVYPDYLAGKYAWTLDVLDDESAKSYFMQTFMNPDNYPYDMKLQRALGTRRHFLNTLLMHGVSEDEYRKLDRASRDSLYRELDNAVTRVLKKRFPKCSTMEMVDYDAAYEWETPRDVIEAMLDYLIERGLVACEPWEDLDE